MNTQETAVVRARPWQVRVVLNPKMVAPALVQSKLDCQESAASAAKFRAALKGMRSVAFNWRPPLTESDGRSIRNGAKAARRWRESGK